MKILHAFNVPRSGGGSIAATRATIEVSRQHGLEVEVFSRDSGDLPDSMTGRFRAAAGSLYARRSVKEFSALLDSTRPDVVHANELYPLISPWILPQCTRRNIPVVMTCDDYHVTCPVRNHFRDGEVCTRCADGHEYWAILKNCKGNLPESLTNAFYNFFVRRLDLFRKHVSHFTTPSEFSSRWLVERAGIDPERVSTIWPRIDMPAEPVDPVNGSYAAYAGRLVPEKGIDTLIQASRLGDIPIRLSRNEHHFETVLLPPELEVVITRGRDDLAEFYRGARMLVVPSVWFETFGIVGAEAMSHGIPVIASRLGALADLVEDGVDGLLFEPGDPRDLADAIQRLWNDPELCRRMGRAGREKVARLWRADLNYERLLAAYERARAHPITRS